MESVLGRYRNLIILVGVLFLQVLGLAMQVKKSGSDEEKTRLIRVWAVDAVTPFERAVVWIENGTRDLWHNYFYLRGVRAENRQLKQQIEHMRLEQVRLADDAAQARRLQILLAFKEQFISRTVAAQVIGSSGSDLSRIIYIDKGKNAGIEPDMAVMTSDGVVGKVLLAYPSVAQVLLISDQSSGVGAMLEKTRLQGVLRGTANGEVVLERVMSDEQVPVGEAVLTSGGDQIFPKGLPVGRVTEVGSGKDLFLTIKIKPAADLSKLEEVLVLIEKQEQPAPSEDAVHLRASDILAQRLPSVPDKPAADAKSAAGAAGTGPRNPATPLPAQTKPQITKAVKSSSGASGVHVTPRPEPPTEPADAVSTPSRKSDVTGVPTAAPSTTAPTTAAEPDAAQTKPATPRPKSGSPSTPSPTTPPNSQPPVDPNSPQ
jgi:rod shape-determining protein MreC